MRGEAKSTQPRLPRGWKIYSIEASDGKRKRSIDFEFTGGVTVKQAVEQIVEMVRDYK
jgi:hypothetical protein